MGQNDFKTVKIGKSLVAVLTTGGQIILQEVGTPTGGELSPIGDISPPIRGLPAPIRGISPLIGDFSPPIRDVSPAHTCTNVSTQSYQGVGR